MLLLKVLHSYPRRIIFLSSCCSSAIARMAGQGKRQNANPNAARKGNPARVLYLKLHYLIIQAKLAAEKKRGEELAEELKQMNVPHWLAAPVSELSYEELKTKEAFLNDLSVKLNKGMEECMRRVTIARATAKSNGGEGSSAMNLDGDAAEDAPGPSKPWV